MTININELYDVFIRAMVSLIALFLITKLLGKKQVSQMSLFDYVIGISIGNFAAEMTINLESNGINGIFAVIIFGLVAYLISYLSIKSIIMRRYFIGTPSIILEKCRINGYFDIDQIEYAILEANGDISILPKSKYRTLNTSDMNLKVKEEGLCRNIIIDGKIMKENLNSIGKNKDWVFQQLKVKGYNSLSKILLMTIDGKDNVKVYETSKIGNDRDTLE